MTPQEKAKELIDKFNSYLTFTKNDLVWAKKCALICVDEIINNSVMQYSGANISDNELFSDYDFWQSVRTEILNFK